MTEQREHEYDVVDDLGMAFIRVIRSSLVPPGQYYLMSDSPEFSIEPLIWERQPVTVKGEATKIVHEGLADVLAWLREAGHEIPTWEVVDDAEQWRLDLAPFHKRWVYEEHASMTVLNPSAHVVVTTP